MPGSVSPSCAFVGSARAYQLDVSVRAMKSISSCVNLYDGEVSELRLLSNVLCDMERVELEGGKGLGLPSAAADARLLLNQTCQPFWYKNGGVMRLRGLLIYWFVQTLHVEAESAGWTGAHSFGT